REAGNHIGGHSDDQEFFAVERRVQLDAESEMWAVRPQEPMARFAPPRTVLACVRKAPEPERRRRLVRWGAAARHGDSPAGKRAAGPVSQAARVATARRGPLERLGAGGIWLDARGSGRLHGPSVEPAGA